MKKGNKEVVEKRVKSTIENNDKKEIAKQELIKELQEKTKEMLLPNLKDKMKETTEKIIDILNKKDISNIQIMSLIAKGSLLENILGGNISYTAQELKIGFDLYLYMINKINEIKSFPPTVESFANFMGISRDTYNNYLIDPDRREVMNFIHSYLLGVLATSTLTGEVKEISGIYLQKAMGKVEQVQPIVVEHKKSTDIEDINKRLEQLKPIIEADYNEK